MLEILELLKHAEQKEIAELRCFIVDTKTFHDIVKLVGDTTNLYSSDMLMRRERLENFEIRLSSEDQNRYFVCTKAKPLLDEIWKTH